MSEAFATSGESSNITAGPAPRLQGLFIPGIDNSQFVDGFGIVTPWGGGSTARRYGDYGISTEISRQDTQLRDLASSLIPAEGGGFDLEGLVGPQGIRGFPGRDGIDGIIHVMGLNLPVNSNLLTELPHNLDLINALGTASNKLIYTSGYTAYRNFVWANSPIAAVSSWNDSDIDVDASFLIIAADAGIYISTDDGDSWGKDNPDDDTYIQTSCAGASGEAVVLGNTYRENGTIWVTDDYGVNWTEKTVGDEGSPTGDDLCVGTTDGDTLDEYGTWTEREITFVTPIEITSDTKYAIVVRAASDDLMWSVRIDNPYANGDLYESSDSGSSWTIETDDDCWFKTKANGVEKDDGSFDQDGFNRAEDADDWNAQTFTTSSTYTISSVVLKLSRWPGTTPGIVTISIRATEGTNVRGICLGSGGSFLVATAEDGVYLSTDLGDNWTRKIPDAVEDTDWVKGICSDDGTYIIVVSSTNTIYRSANSGTSWATITPAGGDTFSVNKLAISDDGQYMVIVGQNSTDATESCYISTDYGTTWIAKKPVAASIEWTECDISNDGAIIAVSTSGYFYISLDSGATWLEQGMASSAEVWEGLSISGDGTTGLVANTNDNNEFFIGTNTELYSEATWAETALTSAGRAILDDANAAAQATTLGLGTGDSPTFVNTTLTDLTASSLVGADASKLLEAITIGTGLDYTRPTLSLADPLVVPGKLTAGSFSSPIDVTATRQYGFEIHYSGNDYSVTGVRSRATLITTNTTATAEGGLFQATNNNGIDVGVLNGIISEAIGKSDTTSATITIMRGGLSGTEWGVKDTVTNLFGHHIRIHSRNAAGEGSFGTGYGLYLENEAVGGNGQALDAGIYFKGTNLSAGNKAFTYGIDFTGGTYGTSQINLIADGSITMAGTQVIRFDDTNYNVLFGSGVFDNDEGQYNVGIGYQAGYYNNGGDDNVFIGYQAGRGPVGGSTGGDNVAIGKNALLKRTTGSSNFALGGNALDNLGTGSHNIAVGVGTLSWVETGNYNVALGQSALANCRSNASNNVAIGRVAGLGTFGNYAPWRNVFIGVGAGIAIQSVTGNVLIGESAGAKVTTGDYNVMIGYSVGCRQTTNSNLLIIDNQDRGSAAAEITDCLIYGIFSDTVANQTLRINAALTLSNIAAEDTDVDKFLVDSTGVVKYRTGAQVLSDIGGAGGFVDRGDPDTQDFAVGDLTKDGTWHELDLSASGLPANAKRVKLHAQCSCSSAANQYFDFREKDQTNTINVEQIYSQAANSYAAKTFEIPVGSDGIIEYRIANATWPLAEGSVAGWYL